MCVDDPFAKGDLELPEVRARRRRCRLLQRKITRPKIVAASMTSPNTIVKTRVTREEDDELELAELLWMFQRYEWGKR